MKNLRIQSSLTAAMSLLILMVIIISTLAIMSSRNSLSDINEIAELSADQVNTANRMEVNLMEMRLRMARFVFFSSAGNPDTKVTFDQLRNSLARIEERFAELIAYEVTQEQRLNRSLVQKPLGR